MGSFVHADKPILTVMLKQWGNPTECLAAIDEAHAAGAEAFGLQAESMPREYHTPENWKKIFGHLYGKPLYITNYHHTYNRDLPYETLAEELLFFADCGATLCDLTGDMFCPHEIELTEDKAAIEKQMALIEQLHARGAEVVMSSHVNRYKTGDEVLAIARAHKARGADISKIVTHANNMAEQMTNLQTTERLSRELGIPFLFLSGGECLMHRRLGVLLGCCMSLCIAKAPANPGNPQPLITEQRLIRDELQLII